MMRMPARALAPLAVALLAATPALAQDGPKIDTGDTAWMLTSTALVLMMTVPGLALFYAGMVRKKNVLSTMMQSFSIAALVTVVWMVAGYSIAFGEGGPWVGDLSKLFLSGLAENWDKPFTLGSGDGAVAFTIPETVFLMFQMTFAIITPALITGAFADRMKFSAMVLFTVLWSLLVYSPVAHWVWHPNGWIFALGALDFAGGTVVHINAGIAGLVAALVLGKRLGLGHDNMAPYNLALAVIGAGMLWVGWFGFNAGSAGGAGARAGMAMLATQIAAGVAALSWLFAEWATKGKPSVLGAISGAVAGLVAITPASGFVLPVPALIIGVVAGLGGFWGATGLKHLCGYDDSLDAFGVHGVCGIIGSLLTGVFAYGALSATTATPDGYSGSFDQFLIQLYATAAVVAYTAIGSFILLKITDVIVGLRVPEEEEREGLDVTQHGERIA
ncbi:ammonium transporter, Amt family [Belnapia rosea]|uniref:Ammonium transporter n=2 Tax=Belnapia rosea TaxID=938405 RepID=A0A1G7AEM1_9PROT|nr:ammonium transporter, Amt family [Belnapia rosea]